MYQIYKYIYIFFQLYSLLQNYKHYYRHYKHYIFKAYMLITPKPKSSFQNLSVLFPVLLHCYIFKEEFNFRHSFYKVSHSLNYIKLTQNWNVQTSCKNREICDKQKLFLAVLPYTTAVNLLQCDAEILIKGRAQFYNILSPMWSGCRSTESGVKVFGSRRNLLSALSL